MKKFLLTFFVLASFVIYSYHQRHDDGAGNIKIATAPSTNQAPTTTQPSTQQTTTTAVSYKDGQYTGSAADAFYGMIQVQAVISGGKLTDVKFLQTPNDRDTSVMINAQATPLLKQEALQAQSANVSGVSGATDSSQAFIQSLSSALRQAQV